MQDVIIESSNQSSSLAANVRKVTIKKSRGIFSYMFDWLIKGLLTALLLIMNFLLFAGSGSQKVFADGFMLQPEIMSVVIGLLVFSMLLMLLFSFSSVLQNLLVSLIAAGFVWALLSQFAVYDKTSILVPMLSPYIGAAAASMFTDVSHWILVAGAGILTFVVLTISSKSSLVYFVGIIFVVFGGVVADSYIMRDRHQEFAVKYDNHLDKIAPNAKKYVYFFLPNATSYVTLGDLKDQLGSTAKGKETQERLIAFLAKNNFWVYPNAYTMAKDPLMSMVEDLNNIDDEKAERHIQRNVAIDSVWKFHNITDEYVYLKDTQLIDVYKNSKYRVSAYQSRGIDFCNKNNERNVDKCVDKINVPVSAEGMKLSTWEKSKFLLVQWLNSFHLSSDWSTLYGALNGFISAEKTPIIGIPYDYLYVVNSFKTLDVVLNDIANDKGNRAYFVFMDLPSDMYVYDEFCRVKPQDKWLAMDNYKWVSNKNLFAKRQAYQEQFSCMLGSLEQFMQKLNEKQLDKNTVIVLQGISGINDIDAVKTDDYIAKFKSDNLVLLAIKDPSRNNFSINNQICESRELVRNYLYKQGNCREFNRMELHSTAASGLQKELLKSVLTKDSVNQALAHFNEWYGKWKAFNSIQKPGNALKPAEKNAKAPVPAEEIPLPEAEETETADVLNTTELPEEKNVGEVKVMEAPIDEGSEVEVKSISAEIQEKEKQSEGDTLTSSSSAEDISAKTETNEEKTAELIDSATETAVSAEEVPSGTDAATNAVQTEGEAEQPAVGAVDAGESSGNSGKQ